MEKTPGPSKHPAQFPSTCSKNLLYYKICSQIFWHKFSENKSPSAFDNQTPLSGVTKRQRGTVQGVATVPPIQGHDLIPLRKGFTKRPTCVVFESARQQNYSSIRKNVSFIYTGLIHADFVAFTCKWFLTHKFIWVSHGLWSAVWPVNLIIISGLFSLC